MVGQRSSEPQCLQRLGPVLEDIALCVCSSTHQCRLWCLQWTYGSPLGVHRFRPVLEAIPVMRQKAMILKNPAQIYMLGDVHNCISLREAIPGQPPLPKTLHWEVVPGGHGIRRKNPPASIGLHGKAEENCFASVLFRHCSNLELLQD